MKNNYFLLILVIFGIMFSGCGIHIPTVKMRLEGGPGAITQLFNDVMSGNSYRRLPVGFTGPKLKPESAKSLGVIYNPNDGIKNDLWFKNSVGAEVKTTGWVKIYNPNTGKWVKKKLGKQRWLHIENLTSIYFNSPFLQGVEIRYKACPDKKSDCQYSEMIKMKAKFNTFGWDKSGNTWTRINPLYIKLPIGNHEATIVSYSGPRLASPPKPFNIYASNTRGLLFNGSLVYWKKSLTK